jgi:hypothetical protein
VIYGRKRYTFVEYRGQNHAEIELIDASDTFRSILLEENFDSGLMPRQSGPAASIAERNARVVARSFPAIR